MFATNTETHNETQVVQVVFVLVLGFLFQESKTHDVSLTQICNISFTSVNCFYNGTSTATGFAWYNNGERCGIYSHVANGTCSSRGITNCTDFTYTCPKSNTSTMTVYDKMQYSEQQQIITCQPIQNTSTNNSQLNNRTLHLKVHPRLYNKADIDDKISHKIDENVELWIKVVALPPPNFTWFKISDENMETISSRTNLKVVSKKLASNLTIFRILPSDGGTYMVRAENECGAVEQQYHIKVEVPEKDSQLIDPMFVRIVVPVAVVVLLVGVAAVVIVCVRWKNGGQREANRQEYSADPERTYQPLNNTIMGQSSIYNALELNVYANDDW